MNISSIPWQYIDKYKESYNFELDRNLVAAIIFSESACNQYAIRFEPFFKQRYQPEYFANINGITEKTEYILQSCSFGYMQIMGCVAREIGFTDVLTKLFEPDLAIYYGCKKLGQIMFKYKNLQEAISVYNGGSLSYVLIGGKKILKNMSYVNKVLTVYEHLNAIKK